MHMIEPWIPTHSLSNFLFLKILLVPQSVAVLNPQIDVQVGDFHTKLLCKEPSQH